MTVQAWGGGGGGQADGVVWQGNPYGGAGGGGGSYCGVTEYTVSGGALLMIAVGAPGAAGAGTTGASGNAGGDSSVKLDSATVLTAKGGGGGGAIPVTPGQGGAACSGGSLTGFAGGTAFNGGVTSGDHVGGGGGGSATNTAAGGNAYLSKAGVGQGNGGDGYSGGTTASNVGGAPGGGGGGGGQASGGINKVASNGAGGKVIITFISTVNGACGSAANTPTTIAPAGSALCKTGTASAVSSNTNDYSWTCQGSGASATNASCTAPRQYTVTASAGANGTLSCPSPVTGGKTSACTVTPTTGYQVDTISGCSGSLSGNTYTTGALSANCTVTASFKKQTFTVTATASPTVGGNINCSSPVDYGAAATCTATPAIGYAFAGYTGDCSGTNPSCTIPNVQANKNVTGQFALKTFTGATPGGTASVTLSGGGDACGFDAGQTAFVAASNPPPTKLFPVGAFKFKATSCTPNSTITLTVTYSKPLPAGARMMKFGPTAASSTPSWYVMTDATLSGATGTYTVTDNSLRDLDPAAGVIVDPAGPAIDNQGALNAVPTLSEWALMLMGLLMAGMSALRLHRQRMH